MSNELTWLAVDGGQSGIRLRHGPAGRDAASAGVQHRPGGPMAGMLASIRDAFDQLGNPPVDVAALGMSGIPKREDAVMQLADEILVLTAADRVFLSGDHVTTHLGAFDGAPGVVAAVGTGVAVLGLTPSGQLNRVDGRGYLLGDDGSAFQLGCSGVRAVLEHAEGLGHATTLTERAVARFGQVEQIAESLYHSATPVSALASFAKDVVDAARDGDRLARDLVRIAMDKVARSITAAAMGFGDSPVPVVITGGLMAGHDVLDPVIRECLDDRLPDADLRDPAGGPLDGAVLLARQGPGSFASEVSVHDRRTRSINRGKL